MLKIRAKPKKRRALKPDLVVFARGNPTQERLNKAALEMVDRRIRKMAEMTDAERKAAGRDFKQYEAELRAYALSPRNR